MLIPFCSIGLSCSWDVAAWPRRRAPTSDRWAVHSCSTPATGAALGAQRGGSLNKGVLLVADAFDAAQLVIVRALGNESSMPRPAGCRHVVCRIACTVKCSMSRTFGRLSATLGVSGPTCLRRFLRPMPMRDRTRRRAGKIQALLARRPRLGTGKPKDWRPAACRGGPPTRTSSFDAREDARHGCRQL